MKIKKDAEIKERHDDRQFFHKIGVKSSDVYYRNDDKVEEKRSSLRGQGRETATKLNQDHFSRIEESKKKMMEQAQLRQQELEKLKKD